jgi:tetratricopeptide (TPR) repeat protein
VKVRGQYFNGIKSKKFDAELFADNQIVSIVVFDAGDEPIPQPTRINELIVSSRLHEVPRSLRFPSGQQFLTEDNDRIDYLLESDGVEQLRTIPHRLESYTPFVAVCWIALVALMFSFVEWGIPAIAEDAALLVPESLEQSIGQDVLKQMDNRGLVTPSKREDGEQDRLSEYLHSFDQEQPIDLVFRSSAQLGANALALPGGIIILTDDLISLAENVEQLLSVYLHEMGHVKHRHVIKQGLQNSMLSLLIMAVTGDLTAATDLAATIPNLLLFFNYSRKFETEADQYALRRLGEEGVDVRHFASMMTILTAHHAGQGASLLSSGYLSTHPVPEDRMRMITAAQTKRSSAQPSYRAIDYYTEAIEQDPNDAKAYFNRGHAYDATGQYDFAIADFSEAIEIDPKLATAYFNRGVSYHRIGQDDQAISDYTRAIEIDPNLAVVYVNRGVSYRDIGQDDQAISDNTKAIELNPRFAAAYNNRGNAYGGKGQHDQAISDYTKAIELNPQYAEAYLNRGRSYGNSGQHDLAIAEYTIALEISPEDARAHNAIAWLLATCPDTEFRNGTKAIEHAQTAVQIEPEAVYIDTLAAAYAESGRFDEAIETQEEAISLFRQQGATDLLDEGIERLESYEIREPFRSSP